MEGVMSTKRRDDELAKQVDRIRRETGLEEKLERYRDRRRAYDSTVRGPAPAPSVPPAQRESRVLRQGSRNFSGDALF
jgi:hypothetical protein